MVSRKSKALGFAATATIGVVLVVAITSLARRAELDNGHSSSSRSIGAADDTKLAQGVKAEALAAPERKVEPNPSAPSEAAAISNAAIPDALQPVSLRLAIETTLVGQIDPGGFLDTALALSALEISSKPIPEPTASGSIRYPLLGTPDGVTAELWVAGNKTATFGGPRLTYHVNVTPPDGYIFEGAARRGLEAQIALWTDPAGKVKHYSVITDCAIAPRSRQIGLGWEDRKIATGAFFSYDAAHPGEWSATNCGFNDGVVYDADDQPTTVQGAWPRTDDLERLKNGLSNQYGKL